MGEATMVPERARTDSAEEDASEHEHRIPALTRRFYQAMILVLVAVFGFGVYVGLTSLASWYGKLVVTSLCMAAATGLLALVVVVERTTLVWRADGSFVYHAWRTTTGRLGDYVAFRRNRTWQAYELLDPGGRCELRIDYTIDLKGEVAAWLSARLADRDLEAARTAADALLAELQRQGFSEARFIRTKKWSARAGTAAMFFMAAAVALRFSKAPIPPTWLDAGLVASAMVLFAIGRFLSRAFPRLTDWIGPASQLIDTAAFDLAAGLLLCFVGITAHPLVSCRSLAVIGPAVGLVLAVLVVAGTNPPLPLRNPFPVQRRRLLELISIGVLFVGAGTGLVLFVNQTFGPRRVTVEKAVVLRLTDDGSVGRVTLLLDGTAREVRVRRDVFEAAKATCMAIVQTSPGALGMPWIKTVAAAAEGHPGTCQVEACGRAR